MVWGQHWLVVLLPIFSLVSAIGMASIPIYASHAHSNTQPFYVVSSAMYIYSVTSPGVIPMEVSLMLYISFVLATTLYCTMLIIYRIVAVAGVRHGPVGQLGVFRHFIEVLVESSALYSISLILYLAFTIHNDFGTYYLDVIAGIAKVCP